MVPSPNIKCSWIPSRHVFKMDVDHAPLPSFQDRIDGTFLHAMHMSKIDGELKEGMVDSFVESAKPFESINEHARLGLESKRHVGRFGVRENRL